MKPDVNAGSSHPRVAIVVLNWMAWRDTIECLESLFNLDYPNFQVVLCDNASSDGSVARIKAWARGELAAPAPLGPALRASTGSSVPKDPVAKPIAYLELDRAAAETAQPQPRTGPLVIIDTGANLGYAGGNNVGLRYGLQQEDFAYFWILNNDTIVDSRALTALVTALEGQTSAGACGSLSLYYGDPQKIECFGGGVFNKLTGLPRRLNANDPLNHTDLNKPGPQGNLDYISGASMLVSRNFIHEIGLMSEEYFLYYEELDWFTRAKAKFSLCVAPDSIIYHKHGATTGSSDIIKKRSIVAEYYLKKSRLKYIKKFHAGTLLTAYALLFITMIGRLIVGPRISSKIIFHVLVEDIFKVKPLLINGRTQ